MCVCVCVCVRARARVCVCVGPLCSDGKSRDISRLETVSKSILYVLVSP